MNCGKPHWRWPLGVAVILSLGGWAVATTAVADDPPQAPPPRVVIPFDFESTFDNGRYGAQIGDMVWKKLERAGGFVIPESMLDVRGWSERVHVKPNHQTPIAKLREIVVGEFGADIGICGKVERVAAGELDVYDLWIKVVDCSADEPHVIFETQARTKTVSEIPHVYVKQALDKLYGRTPEAVAGVDAEAEQRWKDGPNLVRGGFEKGDFEKGDFENADFEQSRVSTGGTGPVAWSPLPSWVTRVATNAAGSPPNHVLRFRFPESVAATTGVLYYSGYFPIEEGATYRFQCRWRTTGSAAKVFIKCYDELPERLGGGAAGTSPPPATETAATGTQRREVYRSQQNLQGPAKTWNTHTEDFTPKHTQYSPQWGRVMLYAYWPAGAVDWDDVIVKRIRSPVAAEHPKVRRPSLETKVSSEDVEKAIGNSPEKPRIPEKDQP